LKRLDSAKEIKGKPRIFFCFILAGLGSILLDLGEFGFRFEDQIPATPRPLR
jgi:hypothetical protein